jgi:hypothetical protein
MAYEQKDGDFALFPNDRKTNERAPDWKGTIVINGTKMEIAGWNKPGRSGDFIAGKWQPMRERKQEPPQKRDEGPPPDDLNDRIPF